LVCGQFGAEHTYIGNVERERNRRLIAHLRPSFLVPVMHAGVWHRLSIRQDHAAEGYPLNRATIDAVGEVSGSPRPWGSSRA
jgi:hypothetical protein